MTTKLLESLIEKASPLPEEVQNMLASQWLAELEVNAILEGSIISAGATLPHEDFREWEN